MHAASAALSQTGRKTLGTWHLARLLAVASPNGIAIATTATACGVRRGSLHAQLGMQSSMAVSSDILWAMLDTMVLACSDVPVSGWGRHTPMEKDGAAHDFHESLFVKCG